MNKTIYLKNKQVLRVEFVDKVKDFVNDEYTYLVEEYLCGEGNGWIYDLILAECDFAYWRIDDDGKCNVNHIDLIEISNKYKPICYVNKIYLDNKLIFDMKDYELKPFLWYDKEEDDYYTSTYLCPKDGIKLLEGINFDLSYLKTNGSIFDKDAIFDKFKEIADKEYDGHFTLLKFTTNWICSFGTITDFMEIQNMSVGSTMEEAILNAIDNR